MCAKILVIGGPMCGKSTYSQTLGIPHYCTDPLSLVKSPKKNVIYLPENLGWGNDSDFVMKMWFTKPDPWVIEGVGVVRALRKWALSFPDITPCDRILYFKNPHPSVLSRPDGQVSMEKAISTIWSEIENRYGGITNYIKW